MKPARDWSAYRQIKAFGKDFSGFLEQPPEFVFTHGACHAFALELRDFLKRNDVADPKLWMISDAPAPLCDDVVSAPSARHVFVVTQFGGADIYGCQQRCEFLGDWRKESDDVERDVDFEDWLIKPKEGSEMESVIGLRVDHDFLSATRELAAKIIQENPRKYGMIRGP